MNIRAIFSGFLILTFSISCANSGPLRDAIKKRKEARQQVNEIYDESDQSSDQITLPPGAKFESDIAYGSDPAQRMDIYLPEQTSGPVLFMVHGGAWLWGDKTSAARLKNKVAWLLPQGIIVISTNYRLSPAANPLEQADDVAKALSFAQAKAETWGGDPDRFVLMGHSAGAHLISLLAADLEIAYAQDAEPWLGSIALDSAAFDVVEIMHKKHFRFYDKVFKKDEDFWREASPSYRLTGSGTPMMLVCSSTRDKACPQAEDFDKKASKMGRTISTFPIALSHRDVNENLGLKSDYTAAVEAFLRTLGIDLD